MKVINQESPTARLTRIVHGMEIPEMQFWLEECYRPGKNIDEVNRETTDSVRELCSCIESGLFSDDDAWMQIIRFILPEPARREWLDYSVQ